MFELAQKRLARQTVKRRQQEIQRCLAEFGLTSSPHNLPRGASLSASREAHSLRLCAALETLGSVFSLFGIYLSSRVDLLPARYCLRLAAIPDYAEPTPIYVIRGIIRQEFGGSFDESGLVMDEKPFESRLLFQSHRALLKDQTEVVIKITHPEFEEQLSCDLQLLPLLKAAFAGDVWSDFAFEHALEEFNHMLQQDDFANQAKGIEALANDANGYEMLRVAEIYSRYCTSKILITARSAGLSLEDLISFCDSHRGGEQAETRAWFEGFNISPKEIARNLCLVWLRQALMGRAFPVEPIASNIEVLSNRQIAFKGGAFASLPPHAKTNLWDYLINVLIEDPDSARCCLTREMSREKPAAGEDELQRRFRQIVPFRDGGWGDGGKINSLAEVLFLHWQLAARHGYRPHSHLLSFYRGLFLIASASRRLAPDQDSLREGLEELRLVGALKQFEEMISPRQFGSNLDKYAAMMMDLPQKLDAVLALAAEGSLRLKLQEKRGSDRRKQSNALATTIALLLLLSAIAILANHLAASQMAGPWMSRVSVMLFVVVGAMLLRALSRER